MMATAITLYALVGALVLTLELSHLEADNREIESFAEMVAILVRAGLWLPMTIAALAALAIDAAAAQRR